MKQEIKILSVDLAKNLIQVLAIDSSGREVFNRQVKSPGLADLVTKVSPSKIVMEACGTSHYWGRKFQGMSIAVEQIPPQLVRPFRMGDKNDANDCWAIYEASLRPKLRPVPVKSEHHQLLQTWLRRRDLLVSERTQRVNAVRAYLAEHGVIIPKGIWKFQKAVVTLLTDERLNLPLREMLQQDLTGLENLGEDIKYFERKINAYAKTDSTCVKLQELAGIGPITAVALVASVVDPKAFKNGRQFAAYLGLVPKQNSSGGKTRLYGIGKDGNAYLRLLLIHGGRSLIWSAEEKTDDVSRWALLKKEQKGFNKASVAVANKNARKAWAVMSQVMAA